MSDIYEVFAIKYGHRVGTRGGMMIYGDPHDAPMPMDYYVWALRNAERTIVVDIGYSKDDGERRGREFLRCPTEGLAAVGIDAKSVKDVIITHMHYDHVGNLDKFPSANFHIQDAEMAYVTGRSMTHHRIRHAFTIDNVTDMVRMLYGDRVQFHDGEQSIAPGISVHLVGGHTRGLQVVRVNTARGQVVLASDASHYYENMNSGEPFTVVDSISDMLEGHRTLFKLADSPEHVVPGHDPLVMQCYPAPTPELQGIAVRLDVPPSKMAG
jgi:glyoxylase-like metal-dependent hydrolase (beta-lactamase superfamily II)